MRKSRDQWRKILGVAIAAARDDADLSQKELGALMGWHRSKVAKIEAGIAGLETAELIMLAHVLDLAASELMARVEKRSK